MTYKHIFKQPKQKRHSMAKIKLFWNQRNFLLCMILQSHHLFAVPIDIIEPKPPASLKVNALLTYDNSTSMQKEFNNTFPYHYSHYTTYKNSAIKFYRGDSPIHAPRFGTLFQPSYSHRSLYIWYIYGAKNNHFQHPPSSRQGGYLHQYPEHFELDWRLLSSAGNTVYYDPDKTYTPWPGYPNTNFNKALEHPDALSLIHI